MFAGFWSVIDTSCKVLWLTISVSFSPGCPHRPQDSVPHKSQPRRFSKFLLHKKAVKKIENKMCVKITLMTRSAYTQPTPGDTCHMRQGRRRATQIYCPGPRAYHGLQGIEEGYRGSRATWTSKISSISTFCTVLSLSKYTHIFSSFKAKI